MYRIFKPETSPSSSLAVNDTGDNQHNPSLEADYITGVAVHPCVIGNKPYIVYPRGLEQSSPQLFRNLSNHFRKQGYQLKEDQRRENKAGQFKHNRRKWAQVILFTTSLLFESAAFADFEIDLHLHSSAELANRGVQVVMVTNSDIRNRISQQINSSNTPFETVVVSSKAKALSDILISRYQQKEGDPAYIKNDLKKMANYYSEYPETVKLFNELKDKDWEIVFDEDNWVTTASGNILKVDNATIHFNTRMAAQLKLNKSCAENPVCIASPADAFLHELLHVHSLLVGSDGHLKQVATNNMLYPYQHEYGVIGQERTLYAAMSEQDNLKRPLRSDHTGRNVKASCPTCIK